MDERIGTELAAYALRVVDRAPSMLAYWDSQHICHFANEAYRTWFGVEPRALIGKPIWDLLGPDLFALNKPHIDAALRGEEQMFERIIRGPDGVERHSLANYLPDWQEGRVAGFVVVVTEVTQLRQTQAALAREQRLRLELEQQADALNRLLKERDELVDLLAHEVRQPLHSTWSAFQGAEAAIRANRMDCASEALVQARSMLGAVTATIDNTLAAARLLAGRGTLTLADTDIDTWIALTLGDLPPLARQRIQIHRVTTVRSALLDSGLMRLALRNLLANAIEYSPAPSPIQILLREQEEPPELWIDVVDQGPGVPAALAPRLFERGVTGRQGEQAAGHGLGLYVVRKVMELHDGAVELHTPHQGCCFRLRLNLSIEP